MHLRIEVVIAVSPWCYVKISKDRNLRGPFLFDKSSEIAGKCIHLSLPHSPKCETDGSSSMDEHDIVVFSSLGDDDMIVCSRTIAGVYSREWITRIDDVAIVSLATVWLVVTRIGIVGEKDGSHRLVLMISILYHHDDIGIYLMDRREESGGIRVGIEDIGVEKGNSTSPQPLSVRERGFCRIGMEVGGGREIGQVDQGIEADMSSSMDGAESPSSTDDEDETDEDRSVVTDHTVGQETNQQLTDIVIREEGDDIVGDGSEVQ